MRISTLKKALLSIVAVMACTVNANAYATYYAYYERLVAYPTGAGQVYINENQASDKITWTDESETQFVSTYGGAYGYAKPADGWIFAGFSKAGGNAANGEYLYNDTIVTTENPGYLTIESTVTDNPSGTSDSSKVAAMMPLDPTCQHFAIFTHITVEVAPGQSELGQASISKVSNNIGDEITLTATPDSGSTFSKWAVKKGNDYEDVSTEPVLNITVSDTARYVAFFKNPNATDYNLKEGEYLMIYPGDSTNISIPGNYYTENYYGDSVRLGKDNSFVTIFRAGYNLSASNAYIVRGKGFGTFVSSHTDYAYASNTLTAWSGDNGVKVDTLDKTHKYYTYAGGSFELASDDDVIAPNQVYLGLPDSLLTKAGIDAPQTIYIGYGVSAGINGVKSVKQIASGIYTIDGVRQSALKEDGLYIIDGRKVLYRRK